MTLRIPDDLNEQLKRQAAAEHTSVHGLIIKAAEEYVVRRGKCPAILAAVEQITTDYVDALRRLGQ